MSDVKKIVKLYIRIPNKKMMDLISFRMNIGESLIYVGKPTNTKKMGRPSTSDSPTPHKKTNKIDVGHLPEFSEGKDCSRCKYDSCSKKTHFYCMKCKIYLCITRDRNCVKNFHTK